MNEQHRRETAGRAAAKTRPFGPETLAGLDAGVHTALQPGERIGLYRIEELLGAGGMGVVYRAHDTELGRTVALKLLSPQLGDDQELLARFRAEAQIQARLTGRHIVTLHSIVPAASGLALVMEFVDGRTLARHLARHGPLAPAAALRVFDHALRGLIHAHRLGVVHCDLKPGNIFLTRDGEVKLMDFGLAHLIGSRRLSAPHLLGTLRYMAPEQIENGGADFRSDLYALGVSLYECVTGRAPFTRDDPKVLRQPRPPETLPPPSRLAPGMPPALETIILTAMAQRPEERYQTAEEMHAAVQGLRRQRAHRPAPPPPRGGSARHPLAAAPTEPAFANPPFTYARNRRPDSSASGPARVPVTNRRRTLLWMLSLYAGLPAATLGVLYLAFDPAFLENLTVWAGRLRDLVR